ncbi:MAG: TlpA family protein disulfide reductase [Candidatus Aminicenantes bacterium]|nr:TlpA family protein disulfide reductase [Candidatus Aminicenantes bacterium]
MKEICLMSALVLAVLMCAAAGPAIGADIEISTVISAPAQDEPTNAPVARYSPAQPKRGEMVELTYDPGAPNAVFTVTDKIHAIYFFFPGGKKGHVQLEPKGDLLSASIPVAHGTGYISVYFITMEGWDRNAQLGIMVYGPDGKPARGANHQEMMMQFAPDTYLSYFEKERALYPENYAIYRDKWFVESAVKKGELEAIIKRELPALERAAESEESAELLFALCYGNLLLGHEEAGRKLLFRMAEGYPLDIYTVTAFSNYDYMVFSNQWKADGPDEVRKLGVRLLTEHPEAPTVRKLIERYSSEEGLSMETAAAVCRAWIRDEPGNPHPYYYFARAAKSKGGDMKEAEAMLSRGLDLLLQGKLRFYEDISGTLTAFRVPDFFSLRAEIRREMGEFADALADIKAAQALNKETRPDYLVKEAAIWTELGFYAKAEAGLVEAHLMGEKEAEAGLREVYARRHGDEDGFEAYLEGLLEKANKGGAGASGPGRAGSATAASAGSGAAGARMGRGPAPELNVKTLDGAELNVSDLRGKAVVLNFWFIGCAPCRVEMPGLNKLVEEFTGEEVVFIAFATDPADKLKEFLEVRPFDYMIVPESAEIARLYGVSAFPTHILINKNGEIAYFLTGGSPDRHDQLRPLIKNLLR